MMSHAGYPSRKSGWLLKKHCVCGGACNDVKPPKQAKIDCFGLKFQLFKPKRALDMPRICLEAINKANENLKVCEAMPVINGCAGNDAQDSTVVNGFAGNDEPKYVDDEFSPVAKFGR